MVALATLAGCAGDDAQGLDTLPPIRTTTTSSTTTTLVDDRTDVYTVKPGENLSLIARSFGVPLSFLIEANQDKIDDPNNVPPGVMLVIPPYVIVDELPAITTAISTSTSEAP